MEDTLSEDIEHYFMTRHAGQPGGYCLMTEGCGCGCNGAPKGEGGCGGGDDYADQGDDDDDGGARMRLVRGRKGKKGKVRISFGEDIGGLLRDWDEPASPYFRALLKIFNAYNFAAVESVDGGGHAQIEESDEDADFRAGFEAGAALLKKRPDADQGDADRAYNRRVARKYGNQWKAGFLGALAQKRGAHATDAARKAKSLGLTLHEGRQGASLNRQLRDKIEGADAGLAETSWSRREGEWLDEDDIDEGYGRKKEDNRRGKGYQLSDKRRYFKLDHMDRPADYDDAEEAGWNHRHAGRGKTRKNRGGGMGADQSTRRRAQTKRRFKKDYVKSKDIRVSGRGRDKYASRRRVTDAEFEESEESQFKKVSGKLYGATQGLKEALAAAKGTPFADDISSLMTKVQEVKGKVDGAENRAWASAQHESRALGEGGASIDQFLMGLGFEHGRRGGSRGGYKFSRGPVVVSYDPGHQGSGHGVYSVTRDGKRIGKKLRQAADVKEAVYKALEMKESPESAHEYGDWRDEVLSAHTEGDEGEHGEHKPRSRAKNRRMHRQASGGRS